MDNLALMVWEIFSIHFPGDYQRSMRRMYGWDRTDPEQRQCWDIGAMIQDELTDQKRFDELCLMWIEPY